MNNPSKVRKLSVFDIAVEHAEDESDLWLVVRSPTMVMKSNKLADPLGLFTGKQHGCDCDHDQA
jgi:hypothetical protein